jgi:hypothetical protein
MDRFVHTLVETSGEQRVPHPVVLGAASPTRLGGYDDLSLRPRSTRSS